MYFTALPDHSKPGFDEQLHFSKFRKHNIIFNTLSGSGYCDKHVGCLSFKTVFTGEEWYGINNNRVAVRPGQFLVLNDEQTYSCNIAGGEKVRGFSVFFKNEFAASVLHDTLSGEGGQLDNYDLTNSTAPEFFQTLTNFD
ncbi:MAG: AraC family ligand binding domain-containing protein, partial [Mucilaginibacter sp.]